MKSFHRSCHALRASPHLTACPAVSTEVSLSDSLFSSRPAWSLGLDVRPVLVLRCTCTRQRWILVPGHACVHAASAPVLLQCLFDRFGSVFPQCGLMVFPGVVIVSR